MARSITHASAVLCAYIATAGGTPASAGSVPVRHDDLAVAHCIQKVAGGRDWLAKTLWGLRDQEGGWIGARIANSNGTHDLGPLQINSWWVPRIATSIDRSEVEVARWLRFDACFNAGAARWIFVQALEATGDYWRAVGVYHSPTGWRQQRYVAGVADHLQRRFGADVFRRSPTRVAVRNPRSRAAPGRPPRSRRAEPRSVQKAAERSRQTLTE